MSDELVLSNKEDLKMVLAHLLLATVLAGVVAVASLVSDYSILATYGFCLLTANTWILAHLTLVALKPARISLRTHLVQHLWSRPIKPLAWSAET